MTDESPLQELVNAYNIHVLYHLGYRAKDKIKIYYSLVYHWILELNTSA